MVKVLVGVELKEILDDVSLSEVMPFLDYTKVIEHIGPRFISKKFDVAYLLEFANNSELAEYIAESMSNDGEFEQVMISKLFDHYQERLLTLFNAEFQKRKEAAKSKTDFSGF